MYLVTRSGVPIGWMTPTGIFIPAVAVTPPGSPVGKAPPLDRGHWGG
jgi:hypothetical protein